MKIDYLQISNVLSFPFVDDIASAEKLTFDSGLNIIIGENGSGKSTALEVLNFLFKRVLYRQCRVNQDHFSMREAVSPRERKDILQPDKERSFGEFRLDPNWDTESEAQKIRLAIRLDDIDLENIENLWANLGRLSTSIEPFSTHSISGDKRGSGTYEIEITLNKSANKFEIKVDGEGEDFGFRYLKEYNFLKEAIVLHNVLNQENPIAPLQESLTLISGYRNYHAFQPSISLKDEASANQISRITDREFSRSLNSSDGSEPPIFALVKLRLANEIYKNMSTALTQDESEIAANKSKLMGQINSKIRITNLECRIRLIELRTWTVSFEFFDLRRQKGIANINSLSAGQKAIIHLVFEAYGRGELKGGLVIIDEPEIHLHFQYQHQLLRVIYELNIDQNCQYILATHSEALINSSTIKNVRRMSLNSKGHTEIYAPKINTEQKNLIKILDNTKSTYAFFAKKVILVEGDTDRYFFRAIIQDRYAEFEQEIAVLHMGGKREYPKWRKLFLSFGLTVSFITDFDYMIDMFYPEERGTKLKTDDAVSKFREKHVDWKSNIELAKESGVFILREGCLESYTGPPKGLGHTIKFCRESLPAFLDDVNSPKSKEILRIVSQIAD